MEIKDRKVLVLGGWGLVGLAICKLLAEKNIKVILTSRNEKKGKDAVKTLNKENIIYHQLDVTDQKSINKLADYIKKEFGELDILVNNAGIFIDNESSTSILKVPLEMIKKTIETNTYGPLLVSRALAPMMKKGRIVNMSSTLGQLTDMGGQYPGYRISKTALNSITRILASELRGKVLVNSMCPGYVRTDMTNPSAPCSPEEGADTAIFLATEVRSTGKFFQDREEIEW